MEVRWQKSMPVTGEGRFFYASSEDLTAWVGTESGKNEPVHIASEAEELGCRSQAGSSYVSAATEESVRIVSAEPHPRGTIAKAAWNKRL